MTKAVRLSQADIVRAIKAAQAAGVHHARIILHLERGQIEIVLEGADGAPPAAPNEWDDE